MEKIFLEIKNAMDSKRVTEQWLSDVTGIPQSTVHRIVAGKNKKVDPGKIRVIQKALGIQENNFIEPYHWKPWLESLQPRLCMDIGETYDSDEESDDPAVIKYKSLPRRHRDNIMEVVKILSDAPASLTYEVLAWLHKRCEG